MGTTVLPESPLLPRRDGEIVGRLSVSGASVRGLHTLKEFDVWMLEQKLIHRLEAERAPFSALEGWSFAKEGGNLTHASGGRYSIEGMRILAWTGPICEWYQPVVNLSGVGVHGLLVKEFDGVLHCLVRAGSEPGHPEAVQIFPTVQATRGDYATSHPDPPTHYLGYFLGQTKERVVIDVLQSANGHWFYRNSNRTMVVETTADVELREGFFWLTLGQLNILALRNKCLSVGLRSVLGLLPPSTGTANVPDRFKAILRASSDPDAGALLSDAAVSGWLSEQRSYREVEIQPVPLNHVSGWHRTDREIARADGKYFSVMGAIARGRDATYGQPLVELRGQALAAFVVKEFDGVAHVLARASMESGLRDSIEIGPSVQCNPAEYERGQTSVPRPFLLDYVLGMDKSRIRYDVFHTGDGSAFFHPDCRYQIIEADASLPAELPQEYAWVALGQLATLARQSHCVNSPARTLIACVNALH
jgi:oxidase EvaA